MAALLSLYFLNQSMSSLARFPLDLPFDLFKLYVATPNDLQSMQINPAIEELDPYYTVGSDIASGAFSFSVLSSSFWFRPNNVLHNRRPLALQI